MDSISSSRNDSPFRPTISYSMSRGARNSPRRQSSTLASGSGSFRPGFSPQRTTYNSGQCLSRSYDSPEGIHRLSHFSAKMGSSSLRRAASPPACTRDHTEDGSASGRNQTVLDDTAWMLERYQSLQKTGFLRYPSVSKLRDSGEVTRSLQSPSASCTDDELRSTLSCPSHASKSSTGSYDRTVVSQTDEPLAAFKLSEVTLSEEDLLTDIPLPGEFSTCNSAPVVMQSSGICQGTPLSQDVGVHYQKITQQNNMSPYGNAGYSHTTATPELTSSSIRGDLLLRLEALQQRAELASKGGNDPCFSNSIGKEGNQNSKLLWKGQVPHLEKDVMSSSQDQWAFSHQINAAPFASPTHSNLSSELTTWPEEVESSLDSTCWLKGITEKAKTEPSLSRPVHRLSRSIRPEYYLPLSREEEPVFEDVASHFSSPKGGKRKEPTNDEKRRSAKILSDQKQASLSRKSKMFMKTSVDKYGSGQALGKTATLSPTPSPGAARRALTVEARSSQSHHSAIDHKGITHPTHDQRKHTKPCFETKAGVEIDRQARKFEYDEASWISEENVEGFLHSHSFALDKADGVSTSNPWSRPDFDANFINDTAKAPFFPNKIQSRNNTTDSSHMENSIQGLFPLTHNPIDCIKEEGIESMAALCSFSQTYSATSNSTDRHVELLNDSPQLVQTTVCQILNASVESRNNDLTECCSDTLSDKQSLRNSEGNAEVLTSQRRRYSSCISVSPKVLSRVIAKPEEKIVGLEAETMLECPFIGEYKCATYSFYRPNPSVSACNPLSLEALSSPSDLLGEEQCWHGYANNCYENAKHVSKLCSPNASEETSLQSKDFSRIIRSLSFSDQGNEKLELSTNSEMIKAIGDSKSTDSRHHRATNSSLALKGFELEYIEDIKKISEEKLNSLDSAHMQETSKPTKEMVLQEMRYQICKGDVERLPEGNVASLLLPDHSHTAHLKVEQLAKVASDRAPTVPLSRAAMTEADAVLHRGCCEASPSIETSRLQSQECPLDRPLATQSKVQDDSKNEGIQEHIKHPQQVITKAPNNENEIEIDSKRFHRQSGDDFNVGEALCMKTLQAQEKEMEPERIFEKSILSEQLGCMASIANDNKGSKMENVPQNSSRDSICGRRDTAASLLSIYKNPLWRDDLNVDYENGHGSQNLIDYSHSDEGNAFDSDENRIGFSKRSLGEVWDTYEGIGGFISPSPNSPSFTANQASHILVNFHSVVKEKHSSMLDLAWDVKDSGKKLGEGVSKVSGLLMPQRLGCSNPSGEHPESTQSWDTKEPQAITHDASASSLADVDRDIYIASVCSPCACNGGLKAISRLKEVVPVTDIACKSDKVQAGRKAFDKVVQNDARIPAPECEDEKIQNDFSGGYHDKESNQSAHQKLVFANAGASENENFTNDMAMLPNAAVKTGEMVKQVTFVYPESKEPQKNQQAAEVSLTEFPADFLSTWILSFFTHPSKGGSIFKRKEQNYSLLEDKKQEDQSELKRIGKRVQALEAQIDRFRQENTKLKGLLKFMIRKVRQLQHGLQLRKRNGGRRGFMTCIHMGRVKRSSKPKVRRKS